MIINLASVQSFRVDYPGAAVYAASKAQIVSLTRPGDRLELILHQGAKANDASGFRFVDPTGRIECAAPDRGAMHIDDPEAERDGLVALAKAWFVATA